jgi:hypothetical protein
LHTPIPHGCSCGRRTCDRPGKHPRWHRQLITDGLHQASTDPDTIRRWWTQWPEANVGLRTGEIADVCDIDSTEGRQVLLGLLGAEAILGPTVRTGSGHWHLYVAATGHGNRVGLLPGVDWRGANGYIVAPPSLHATGRRYQWHRPLTTPLPACPEPLLDLLTPSTTAAATHPTTAIRNLTRYAQAAIDAEVSRILNAPVPHGNGRTRTPGGRNSALNTAAYNLGRLIGGGALDERHVARVLTAAALRVKLGPVETARTIRSGLQAGKRQPRRPAIRRKP